MLLRSSKRFSRLLIDGLRIETQERSNTSAMVFAPHQDDETLGCGGTVILKRGAGAMVTFVFMTDGRTSHRKIMKEDQLRSLRKMEAINAASVLGLSREDVHFLDYPDGELKRFHSDAVSKIVVLLNRCRPQEVYVPYRFDGTSDHEYTHAVVVEAVSKTGMSVEVCEYPIWFWNQWPWVPMELKMDRAHIREFTRALWECFVHRHFKEFRSGVYVGDDLERKMEALAQHRSQMTVMVPGTAWSTLEGISAGEFLRCFFRKFEVFRCWNIRPTI